MIYNTKDSNEVFWATIDGFKNGRDPLGIENSSVALYSLLVPGLTNLTGRVRYYSFFCWLLSEYKLLRRNGKMSELEQYDFIRRAELAMAFIMKPYPHTTSVVGRLYTQGFNNSPYNLSVGADLHTEGRKYWEFEFGAFGQYYLGSMVLLGLAVSQNGQHRYHATEKGEILADAYRQSVDRNTLSRFLKVISVGSISDNDIHSLAEMRIDGISKGSDEWKMLNDIFMNKDLPYDNPTSDFRISTIRRLITFCNEEPSLPINDFPRYMYERYNENYQGAEFGWYVYYMQEALHYCTETLFSEFLKGIEDKHEVPFIGYINGCCEELSECVDSTNPKLSIIIERYADNDLPELVNRLIHVTSHIDALKMAVITMLRIFDEVERNKEALKQFEATCLLSSQSGILSQYTNEYFALADNQNVSDFANHIYKCIIANHTAAAYRKTANNSDTCLLKFVIDEGNIMHVATTYPQFTNPRLGSLYNMLIDLGSL